MHQGLVPIQQSRLTPCQCDINCTDVQELHNHRLTLTTQFTASNAGAKLLDGDTIAIDGQRYRLHGIDAPETRQRYGKKAAKVLAGLMRGKDVTCDNRGVDGYNRIIAVCIADGVNLNKEMVRTGYAWDYVKFSSDYVGLEKQARENRLGLWRGKNVAPWTYRANGWVIASQQSPYKDHPIKGNISRNGKIYHMPWSRAYKRPKINEAKCER